jgi:hypothetical protein
MFSNVSNVLEPSLVRPCDVRPELLQGHPEPHVPGGLQGKAVGVQLLLQQKHIPAAVRCNLGAEPARRTHTAVLHY